MQTNWNYVEEIVTQLEKADKLREAKIIDDLFEEATELEDDVYLLEEQLKAYDERLDDLVDFVEDRRILINTVSGATPFEKELIAKIHGLQDLRRSYKKH